MRYRHPVVLAAASLAALAAAPRAGAAQQQDVSQAPLTITKLAGGVSMLIGAGGNIGISAGADGVFLVDDQFAPLAPRIKAKIAAEVSDRPVRFVLNTHWHFDHTGGNEPLGEAGALIVAHDNVRRRMSVEQFIEAVNQRVPASPKVALPVVTFAEDVTFYLNDDTVHAVHVPPAHTDGDVIVHFRAANVLHMGDTFMSSGYPLVDLSSGGSFAGFITAADRALALADAGTKIIPGHGPLATKAELQQWRAMLVGIRDAMRGHIAQRHTLAAIQAAHPTAAFDERWGKGFVKPEALVETIYKEMTRAAPPRRPRAP